MRDNVAVLAEDDSENDPARRALRLQARRLPDAWSADPASVSSEVPDRADAPEELISPIELADRLGAPAWWIAERAFDLPGRVRVRDAQLVGVRPEHFERWQRAAEAAGWRAP